LEENGGPAAPESIGFIGERGDLDTNLLYLNARWYDPVLGRFLTPDWWDPTIPVSAPTVTPMPATIPSNLDRSGHVAPVMVVAVVAVFRTGWASDGGAPMTSSCAWAWLMAVQR
jgi:RHS repeat-associated protein